MSKIAKIVNSSNEECSLQIEVNLKEYSSFSIIHTANSLFLRESKDSLCS